MKGLHKGVLSTTLPYSQTSIDKLCDIGSFWKMTLTLTLRMDGRLFHNTGDCICERVSTIGHCIDLGVN